MRTARKFARSAAKSWIAQIPRALPRVAGAPPAPASAEGHSPIVRLSAVAPLLTTVAAAATASESALRPRGPSGLLPQGLAAFLFQTQPHEPDAPFDATALIAIAVVCILLSLWWAIRHWNDKDKDDEQPDELKERWDSLKGAWNNVVHEATKIQDSPVEQPVPPFIFVCPQAIIQWKFKPTETILGSMVRMSTSADVEAKMSEMLAVNPNCRIADFQDSLDIIVLKQERAGQSSAGSIYA